MDTLHQPDDNPPGPQAATPYFRPARVPEPHWRIVEAVAGLCPPPAA